MKSIISLALVLFFASCSPQARPPLTDGEQAAIQSEIKQAVSAMIRGVEGLNIDSALAMFSNSPEFLSIGIDGAASDYKMFYDHNKEFFDTGVHMSFATIQDEFRFLSDDLVLYSWIYSAKAELNSGEQYNNDKVGATFLFRKLENRWLCVYFQESSLPPSIVKSRK